jgi:acetyl esterase/lipase
MITILENWVMTDTHIIVLPGGSYTLHAPHEAEPVAEWLEGIGIAASVFRYPVSTRHPEPLLAIQAEIARVRAAGATRVGLIGFSAGGHAAGHAALSAGAAVDAAILCYPVVSMELPTHAGSRAELVGENASAELRTATSVDRLVTASAPPFFIWHTAEDEAVPVEHSYLLGQALAAHGVPHALHVFPKGPHGIGLAVGEGAASVWPSLAEDWLRELGWI